MNANLEEFIQRYREGFDAYLRNRDERALTRAYELGRVAVARQLSVLDLASAHQDLLLARVRSDADPTSHEDLIQAAGDFFLESVSAFDVAARVLQEARETARIERRHATVVRHLSTFLADASLALDASESLHEILQLVAEHAGELTGAERCAAQLTLEEGATTIEAFAVDQHDPSLEHHVHALSALYRGLSPPTGSLRMTGPELDRHREAGRLTEPQDSAAWRPHRWLAAGLTALDGRHIGLIQAFDKQAGDFSELDEAILVQLAQMASAAVERAELYRRMRG